MSRKWSDCGKNYPWMSFTSPRPRTGAGHFCIPLAAVRQETDACSTRTRAGVAERFNAFACKADVWGFDSLRRRSF